MSALAVRVVCRPEVAAGFALAGLAPLVASDGAVAGRTVADLAAAGATGVVLIQDTLHRDLPDDVTALLARRPLPIVVPVPGPAWAEATAESEERIVRLLRHAIGYRVRIR
ncbi:MAG TPA: V-type ATP synthase subunit F [Gemmatimonadales bacterium]